MSSEKQDALHEAYWKKMFRSAAETEQICFVCRRPCVFFFEGNSNQQQHYRLSFCTQDYENPWRTLFFIENASQK